MERNILLFKNHCCGCGTCSQVCPRNAITMGVNSQGFLYPTVNKKLCIDCKACLSYCAFNQNTYFTYKEGYPKLFALKHNSDEVRLNSRSGGAFTAITDILLERNGVVYGCELINNKSVKYVRADTKSRRDGLRGSKYIQSDMTDVFHQIKEDLRVGRQVVFAGTACQVAALKSYLKNINTDNLLLIDIICHGVGSPKFWADYVDSVAEKLKKDIIRVEFRNKKDFGWSSHFETFFFEDSKYDSSLFKKMYTSHLILRKDCSDCPYKSVKRVGDITIGDCWGVKTEYPTFYDEKGVSLVFINNEKGFLYFNSIKNVDIISVAGDKLVQQSPLNVNWTLPLRYDSFWKYYNRYGFNKTVQRYMTYAETIMYNDESENILKRMWRKCVRIIKSKSKR